MSKVWYVVKGGTDNNSVFYDTDNNSGGYPYASTFNFKRTEELATAVKWLKECGPDSTYCQMSNPQVCRIVFEPVDVSVITKRTQDLSKLVSTFSIEDRQILKGLL